MYNPRVRSVVRESVLHNPFVLDDEGDPTTPAYVKDGIKVSLQLWNEPIGEDIRKYQALDLC